jgi:DNA-binding transcriptional LysR family regulator
MHAIVGTARLFDNCMNFHTSYSFMNTAFDWNLVRSFLAVLDHGSLLGAARALRASQPTLGRHIAQLEAQLGTVLFERTGRGLVPTDDARRLAESARAMQGAADQLARGVSAADPEEAGTVRITASQPVACYLLPPVLAQMRLALPHVQVELVSSNAVSNLLRREADIALRMVQPDQGSLVARRIGKISLGGYVARRGMPRRLEDLLQHDVIADDRTGEVRRGFHAWGYPVGKEAFALRTDDLIVHWTAVRAGLGVGFVADWLAATDPLVVPVLQAELRIAPLPVWLTVHREIRTSRRIRAVYDFLARAVPKAL